MEKSARDSSKLSTPLLDRFWSRVVKSDGCWMWMSPPPKNGYGRISVNGRLWSVHRLSYQMHFGDIPAGLFVCHHCDNRRCVRPDHLFLGTSLDNVRDMIAKGRSRHPNPPPHPGELHGQARLTASQVIEMRRAYAAGEGSYAQMAARFGVHPQTVASIIQGKRWRHLLDGASSFGAPSVSVATGSAFASTLSDLASLR